MGQCSPVYRGEVPMKEKLLKVKEIFYIKIPFIVPISAFVLIVYLHFIYFSFLYRYNIIGMYSFHMEIAWLIVIYFFLCPITLVIACYQYIICKKRYMIMAALLNLICIYSCYWHFSRLW